MQDLREVLYYNTCHINKSERQLIDDQKRCGLKVYIKVIELDDNKSSIRTRVEQNDLTQTGSCSKDKKCECQSKINELLSTNLNEILSKSSDVESRRDRIQNLHIITKTYDKNTEHFINCSSKPIPQSTNSLSPMDNNVFSPFSTSPLESSKSFFPPQDKRIPRYRKTSRARDLFFIKSQKNSYCNSYNETPIISIETVVTKEDCTCEIVFKTFSIKMNDGKMEKFQRSFVRSILKCQHKDEHNRDNKSEIMANNKPSNKTEVQTVLTRPCPERQNSCKRQSKRSSFHKQKPSIISCDIVKVDSRPRQPSSLNENPLATPVNISSVSAIGQTTEQYEKLDDDFMYMDEGEDDERCIYFEVKEENNACGCYIRKLDIIVDYIKGILLNHKIKALNIILEMENYDEETKHFKGCSTSSPCQKPENVALTRCRNASEISINSRARCNSILQRFLKFDIVKCPEERIIDLIKTKNYNEYNMELLKVINNSEPSPEILSLFFYLTRAIIRHIDDPCYKNNEDIMKIFKFSESYLERNFLTEIQKHSNFVHYLAKYGEVE